MPRVPASVPSFSTSSAMPAIVLGSLTNTATFCARSAASCGGAVYGQATTRSGRREAMRSRSSAACVADARQRARGPRPVAVRDRPDDGGPGAGGEQHLRRMRCEAHDALCRARQRDFVACVVDDGHCACRTRDEREREGGRKLHGCQRTAANTCAPPVE
jgi:hypothetical protein